MLTVVAFASSFSKNEVVESVEATTSTVQDRAANFAFWKARHSKQYLDAASEVRAFSTFIANDEKILAHNARPGITWWMGHNTFSDMTAQEFKSLQGYNKTSAALAFEGLDEHVAADNEILPEEFDYEVASSCSLRVKNQEKCGSCWAFSTVGALEAQLCGPSLSEEDLASCSRSNGCSGGDFVSAFKWVASNGIASESGYPYTTGHAPTSATDSCIQSKEKRTVATDGRPVRVTGENALKSAVKGRAVSIAVDATCLQSYKQGILDDTSCPTNLDHAVLLTGYGPGYWKVKNSWGTVFGEAGYFRVAWGKGMLGIGKDSAYPTGVKSQ